jgi:hypothetical protein
VQDEQFEDVAPEQTPAEEEPSPAALAPDDPGPIGTGPSFRGRRPEEPIIDMAPDDPGPIGTEQVAEGDQGSRDS